MGRNEMRCLALAVAPVSQVTGWKPELKSEQTNTTLLVWTGWVSATGIGKPRPRPWLMSISRDGAPGREWDPVVRTCTHGSSSRMSSARRLERVCSFDAADGRMLAAARQFGVSNMKQDRVESGRAERMVLVREAELFGRCGVGMGGWCGEVRGERGFRGNLTIASASPLSSSGQGWPSGAVTRCNWNSPGRTTLVPLSHAQTACSVLCYISEQSCLISRFLPDSYPVLPHPHIP